MPDVSIESAGVADFLAAAVMERLLHNLRAGTHTNHDGIYRPSQWNYDSSTRHGMSTTMDATATGNTVTLRLIYTVETI